MTVSITHLWPCIENQIEGALRRVLNEQDRNPYSLSFGCFDRRYWAWKLVDYPEATFQRNVYPLAWSISRLPAEDSCGKHLLTEAVKAGLVFSAQLQHRNGSFDQAFPYEQSFGATAFLLHPLLLAYATVRESLSETLRPEIESCLRKAADFLCSNDEQHAYISNHLAGAALSMLTAGRLLNSSHYEERGLRLLRNVLESQSKEGWFPEYGGADPGYQTLCLYYLAQVYQFMHVDQLARAIDRALSFLSWFFHPDGTFGGEYGSRRTALYYPGGLALLSQDFPVARSITITMLRSMDEKKVTTLADIDTGNIAPLLSNYMTLVDCKSFITAGAQPPLPMEKDQAKADFDSAGIYVRGNRNYYALFSTNNGGVFKVFDKNRARITWNDGGYAGQLNNGTYITTQITDTGRVSEVRDDEIVLNTTFYKMPRIKMTPVKFLALRMLNLTVMRSLRVGNFFKKILVAALIMKKERLPLKLERTIQFFEQNVVIHDRLTAGSDLKLLWLGFGRPFIGIHMASAGYFDNYTSSSGDAQHLLDVSKLRQGREIEVSVTVDGKTPGSSIE